MTIAVSRWQTSPNSLPLSPAQLDLWRFRLNLHSTQVAELKNLLAPDEIDRAERLLSLVKQQQFIVARGRVRQLLGRYLNCNPTSLLFEYGAQGKPALPNHKNIHFNLAHSVEWGVLAVTCSGPVGVDVENIDLTLDYQLLGKSYYSAEELATLAGVATARRRRTFYRLWTAKESRLKQQGSGFSVVDPQLLPHRRTQHFFLSANYLAATSFPETIQHINKYHFG